MRALVEGKCEKTWRYHSHKMVGKACERCGTMRDGGRGLSVHHIDLDITNNDPANLMTMCQSCHMKWHGDRGHIPGAPKINPPCCRLCGRATKRIRLGLCEGHYTRLRKHAGLFESIPMLDGKKARLVTEGR